MMLDEASQRYLASQVRGRLATVGLNGGPQNKPVGFTYNPELGTIDISGMNMETSAKYRNIAVHPNVAFVVDDAIGEGASGMRFLEIRGRAEAVELASPTAEGLSPHIIRIHPRRVVSWNLDPIHPGMQTHDVMPQAAPEIERNKEAFRRFIDGMNTNDEAIIAKTIDNFVEPDAKIRTPLPIHVAGAAALKLVFTTLHRAYPDLHVSVEDLIAEGDKVVARNVVSGTHQGEYMGVRPTGKRVTYDEMFVFRFVHGRIVETWGVVDVLAQLRQLGVLPALATPETTS